MSAYSPWTAWICPECGTPAFQPWSACWHVCGKPRYHVQAFDPGGEETGIYWTQMVAIEREALGNLASNGPVVADAVWNMAQRYRDLARRYHADHEHWGPFQTCGIELCRYSVLAIDTANEARKVLAWKNGQIAAEWPENRS